MGRWKEECVNGQKIDNDRSFQLQWSVGVGGQSAESRRLAVDPEVATWPLCWEAVPVSCERIMKKQGSLGMYLNKV